MKTKTEILKICKINYKNTKTFSKAKEKMIRLHELILSYQKTWLVNDNKEKRVVGNIMDFQNLKITDLKVLEKIAHYFHTAIIKTYHGKTSKNLFIIGYQDDIDLCQAYFSMVYCSIQIDIENHLYIHKPKAKLQRERKRAGRKYKEMIHGRVYASNLYKSYISSFHLIMDNLLVNTQKHHIEIPKLRKAKLSQIRQWKQTTQIF